jgi:hypothetical protein
LAPHFKKEHKLKAHDGRMLENHLDPREMTIIKSFTIFVLHKILSGCPNE